MERVSSFPRELAVREHEKTTAVRIPERIPEGGGSEEARLRGEGGRSRTTVPFSRRGGGGVEERGEA